jgi:hypothetical protein
VCQLKVFVMCFSVRVKSNLMCLCVTVKGICDVFFVRVKVILFCLCVKVKCIFNVFVCDSYYCVAINVYRIYSLNLHSVYSFNC